MKCQIFQTILKLSLRLVLILVLAAAPVLGYATGSPSQPQLKTVSARMMWDGKTSGAPSPTIKANGADASVTITPETPLFITISLDSGDSEDQNADWWLVQHTASGWRYLDISGGKLAWQEGLNYTHQGPLFDFSRVEVLNVSGLPKGSHTFYFGVDIFMNGQLNANGALYYDAVTVNVSDNAIFVSPDGDDNNDGSFNLPLKSFEGARNRVRTMLGSTGDITVYFRWGTYVFDKTVILGPQDSGTANQSVTSAAYPGEKPVFTSLIRVIGWSAYSENIMQADLPAGISHVRYLYDESETWMKRSSTSFFRPNIKASCGGAECEHWEPDAQVRKTYTIYPSSFSIPDISKGPQYDLRSHMTAWNAQVLPISGIDAGTRRIDVATPSHYSLVDGIDDLRTECWLLNSLEGIDQPGEWASLDGKVYLWPVSGTDDIYAPALKELIRIDAGGDGNTWSGTPVKYIHFKGITFTGTDYRISEADDVMAQHDWQMVDAPEGLLRFRNAANCSVKNCVFTRSGSDAVRLDRHAQNITIDGSEFSYLGKGGVVMSGRGPGYGDVNKSNTITNNHFKQTSRIKWDAAAVHLDQSSSNLIRQNYFEDIPMSAVIVSGNRESNIAEAEANPINRDFHFAEIRPDLIADPTGASAYFYDHDNIIEENTFRAVHVGTPELIPAVNNEAPGFSNGMIYTTGRKAGGTDTFRKNYFFDVDAQPTYSHTWVILGDGHEDYLDFHQNMAYNLRQTNGFEDPPFMSINCNLSRGCRATANVKLT